MRKIAIILFTLFRKVFGLFWYWAVFPFRTYARSVVHNYALQGRVTIPRIEQRFPKWHAQLNGWVLKDVHHLEHYSFYKRGFVKHRNVSAVEFWLVVFLIWGWLDDDSNADTYDAGHCRRYTEGDLTGSIMGRLFRKQMLKAIEDSSYGNTFDLGDFRAERPCFNFIAVLIWNTRNTAYNFYYLLEEK